VSDLFNIKPDLGSPAPVSKGEESTAQAFKPSTPPKSAKEFNNLLKEAPAADQKNLPQAKAEGKVNNPYVAKTEQQQKFVQETTQPAVDPRTNQIPTIVKESKVAPRLGKEQTIAPSEEPRARPYVEKAPEDKKTLETKERQQVASSLFDLSKDKREQTYAREVPEEEIIPLISKRESKTELPTPQLPEDERDLPKALPKDSNIIHDKGSLVARVREQVGSEMTQPIADKDPKNKADHGKQGIEIVSKDEKPPVLYQHPDVKSKETSQNAEKEVPTSQDKPLEAKEVQIKPKDNKETPIRERPVQAKDKLPEQAKENKVELPEQAKENRELPKGELPAQAKDKLPEQAKDNKVELPNQAKENRELPKGELPTQAKDNKVEPHNLEKPVAEAVERPKEPVIKTEPKQNGEIGQLQDDTALEQASEPAAMRQGEDKIAQGLREIAINLAPPEMLENAQSRVLSAEELRADHAPIQQKAEEGNLAAFTPLPNNLKPIEIPIAKKVGKDGKHYIVAFVGDKQVQLQVPQRRDLSIFNLGNKDAQKSPLPAPRNVEEILVIPINLFALGLNAPLAAHAAGGMIKEVEVPKNIQEIVEQIVSRLETVKTPGRVETIIHLHNIPKFENVKVTVTSYKSATHEINIKFDNLTQEAKNILDDGNNRSALKHALDQKGYTVHMITTTTYEEPRQFGTGNLGQSRDSRNESQHDEQERERERQEHERQQ